MKNIVILVLLICVLLCGCGKKKTVEDDLSKIEKRGKIIVGVREDAPPFGFRNKEGQLVGYDIDLSKSIAKALLGNENAIELVPVTASNRILKLTSGEVDILTATMSITNQREQILDFSYPYYIAGQAILVRSSSKATGLRDFRGKKLIIVFGSTSERNLRTNVPEVDIIGFKTYNDAYKALKAGKAEGIVADDTVLMGYAINDKSVRLLKKRYSKEPYAVTFRKGDENKRLLNKVNYVIDDLQNSKKLNKMQEKWQISNGGTNP